MNELIKELVADCIYQVYDSNQMLYEKFDKEKFALLIIQECLIQVREQYLPVMEDKEMMKDRMWDGYVQCGVDSVVEIREHFGVDL